jgi:hypothetical protein
MTNSPMADKVRQELNYVNSSSSSVISGLHIRRANT